MTPKFRKPAVDRFWSGVVKKDNGCWLFNDNPNSYGRITGDDGKSVSTHRLSYQLHNGEIPNGFYICHKCDVPGCVNPDHLYAGTYIDNNRDRIDRKRYVVSDEKKVNWKRFNKTGELVPIPAGATKQDIRELYATGSYTQVQLAERFGLTQGTVSAIIRQARNYGNGGSATVRRTDNLRRKLSAGQLQEIVSLYGSGMRQVEIASKFGCTQAHVSRTIIKAKDQTT